ncbi:MAG: hypothetical protein WCA54_05340, partial [Pseudolabrys sp.]
MLFRVKSSLFRQPLERSFAHFEIQPVLAFEMIIDGRLIDASSGDDVSHAGILEAFLRKQVNGGFDYILT